MSLLLLHLYDPDSEYWQLDESEYWQLEGLLPNKLTEHNINEHLNTLASMHKIITDQNSCTSSAYYRRLHWYRRHDWEYKTKYIYDNKYYSNKKMETMAGFFIQFVENIEHLPTADDLELDRLINEVHDMALVCVAQPHKDLKGFLVQLYKCIEVLYSRSTKQYIKMTEIKRLLNI